MRLWDTKRLLAEYDEASSVYRVYQTPIRITLRFSRPLVAPRANTRTPLNAQHVKRCAI